MSSIPLKNAKRELFCRHVVSGMSHAKAYQAAGFQSTYPAQHGYRLSQCEDVAARIQYLKELAAWNVSLDRGQIIRMMLEDRELAREVQQVASAVSATKALGVELGMFKERKETTVEAGTSYQDLLREISGKTAPLVPIDAENDEQGPGLLLETVLLTE